MSDSVTTLAIAGCSGVAALIALSALTKTVKRGEWSSAAYLSLGLSLMTFSFVNLIVTYTDTWIAITDVFRVVTHDQPPWAHTVLRLTLAVQGIAAVWLVIARVRRGRVEINIPAAFLSVVALTSVGAAVLQGDHPMRPFTVIYVLTVIACIFAPRGLGIHLGIAVTALIEAISSGFAVWLHHSFAVKDCEAGYKCGVLGFNLTGIMDNENALALSLALSMPFIYMAFRGWRGTALTCYVAGIIALTGSRTGLLAAAVTLAVLLVVRPDARRPDPAPGRSLLLAVGIVPLIAVGAALPFLVNDPAAFTGRVALWKLAREALSDPATLLHGTGVFGWEHVHEAGLIDGSEVYSVHNQWLEVAYSTGLIGLAFFVAAVIVLLWQAHGSYFTVIGCVLVPMVVLSITERPWTIDTDDFLAWVLPGALLCYPAVRARAGVEPDSNPTREEVPVA